MWAIVVKEFRQLRRDRRTLALMFMLPFLFLVVFGYAANFDVKEFPTVVMGPGAEAVADRLPSAFDVAAVEPGEDREDAVNALRDGDAVVAFVTSEGGSEGTVSLSQMPFSLVALVDGTQLFAARTVQVPLRLLDVPTEILFNPDLRTAVIMIPGLTGMILIFVGTVITALGVVRERQAGTLEQLAVMPFRPRDVFLGKITPYLAVAALDMVLIVLVGIWLFDVPFEGSVATFALGAGLFLFVTLGLGVLVSTVSQTQGQAIQLAVMTMVPQFLLSGLFFPVSSMGAAVRWIAYILPLTYYAEIARGVWVRGEPLSALWLPMVVLAVMSVLVFSFSVLRFRRDLAPEVKRPAGDGESQGGRGGGGDDETRDEVAA